MMTRGPNPELTSGSLAVRSNQLPIITAETALFLDFDGTLADLSRCRTNVYVPPTTVTAIASLQRLLSGALAIVTGRTIDDLDLFLAPLRVTAAGMHGAEMRLGDGATVTDPRLTPLAAQQLTRFAATLRSLVELHPGLQLEHKPMALAIHYRGAPQHSSLCWQSALAATQHTSGFEVRPGKMVVEVVPALSNKGAAVRRIMAKAPFQGRRPLFVGDDVADEAAIEAVQSMGGTGIRIVDDPVTPTQAKIIVPTSRVVREWLTGADISN